MKRILLKQDTIDKISQLKVIFNIRKDTTFIEKLVNEKFKKFSEDL